MTLNEIKTITTQIAEAISMPINPANTSQINLKINKLTLMLAAACHATAVAERLLTYKEYVVMQSATYQQLTANQQKWLLKKDTRAEAFYANLTARQYNALLCALDSLTAMAKV